MKLIDFRHVAKQNVLLAEQGAGDEVSHGRVVHLCCIALGIKSTHALHLQIPSTFIHPTTGLVQPLRDLV